jgi:hypothetical protein
MKRSTLLILVTSVAMSVAVLPKGFAQISATETAPVTGMKPDRTTAPLGVREAMKRREAVLRQKRADCRAKARIEKIPLARRPAYVKKCVTLTN